MVINKFGIIILILTSITLLVSGETNNKYKNRQGFTQKRPTEKRTDFRQTNYQFKSEKFHQKSIKSLTPRHDLQTRWYTTRLNHFSPFDLRTINFTYVQHLDYYQPGGPIFIYINDGGIFTTEFLEVGLMHDIAIEAGAALVTSDNRYFRSNLPTENANFTNLEHLTIDQTIQDIARLIQAVQLDLGATSNTRVILWGTGLGATLATWARQKYPNLVDGVWASSGIFDQPVVTNAIYETLSHSIITAGGTECANNVAEAFETLEQFMSFGASFSLYWMFNICFIPNPFFELDVGTFFAGMTQLLIDYINRHHYHGIQNFCTDMNRTNVDKLEAFADWINYAFTDEMCIDVYYYSRVNEASRDNWLDIADIAWEGIINIVYPFPSRPQFYLQCSQLGMFSTNVNSVTIFGTTVGQDLHAWGCSESFGDEYDYARLATAIDTLRIQYGGKNPGVTNAIFTNGQLDPNYSFGITENFSNQLNSYVENIPWHGKSADLFSISFNDSPELQAVKSEIRQLVLEWSNVL